MAALGVTVALLDTAALFPQHLRNTLLYAAAQRLGLGRPPDVTRDPRLLSLVDSHAAVCTGVCGPARVLELEGLMARGVGELALAS